MSDSGYQYDDDNEPTHIKLICALITEYAAWRA